MGKKIVCVGRGGVGKTSFIAGLSFLLKEKQPLLIIDADPDENLAYFFGIEDKLRTVSEILFNIKEGKIAEEVKSLTLFEKIDYLIQQDGLYEGDFFDFLSLGVKWTQGCYCQPNNILRGLILRLEKNYNLVLIDSPAGLEHINRRVTDNLDYLFILVDASQKSFDSIIRFRKLLEDLRIGFKNIFVVANFRYPEKEINLIKEKTGFDCLGKLPYDREVEEINLKGKSFFDLSNDSLFLQEVRKIIKNAGL